MITALSIIGTVVLAISGSIYSFTHYKIPSIWVFFFALVIYSFAFCWFLQSQALKTNNLKKPTFSKKVDNVLFSLGERGMTSGYKKDELKTPREPFNFRGYKPVVLYIKDDNLFADVKIYSGSGFPPIEIIQNEISNIPPTWDSNSNEKAIEIVTQDKIPVYQFIYKSEFHIVMNGIFPYPGSFIVANENGARDDPELAFAFKLKPIFKYPSWKYPGEYAE